MLIICSDMSTLDLKRWVKIKCATGSMLIYRQSREANTMHTVQCLSSWTWSVVRRRERDREATKEVCRLLQDSSDPLLLNFQIDLAAGNQRLSVFKCQVCSTNSFYNLQFTSSYHLYNFHPFHNTRLHLSPAGFIDHAKWQLLQDFPFFAPTSRDLIWR